MSEWCSILCVYNHIHLLHPFISRWTIRLFPCLGYCRFCCCEHRGASIFSRYSFFPDIRSGLELLDHMEPLFLLILRNCHTVFHSGCTSLLYQQYKRDSLFSTPSPVSVIHQVSNDAVLIDMRWYLLAVLICLSLLISNAEHLFICLFAICVSSFKPQISIVRVTSLDFV